MNRRANGFRIFIQALVLVSCIALIGCATAVPSPVLPATADGSSFQVHEYALVEESKDNPDHASFQERVPEAVAAKRTGWPFASSEDALQAPNQALAPFGYRLAANPTPPFSGYALYRNSNIIQRDIARFWPVSLKGAGGKDGWSDFLLSFQTMDGTRLVASEAGIRPWSDDEQSLGSNAPNDMGNPVAFTGNGDSEIGVYTGPDLFYLDGQPFYFENRAGITYLNFNGQDLAYTYDKVVQGNTGSTVIFNPGGTGRIAWFYALRDGLWFYVEVGFFD